MSDKKKLNPQSWRQRPVAAGAGAAGAAERVSNLAAGVGVVIDWLGDSLEPVTPELAEKRASICATCPQNGRPDWIQKLEGWAAQSVKQLINLSRDLNLMTEHDPMLFHCQTCDCYLPLKVWCKMDHIMAHTGERVLNELPAHCWIKKQDKP